MKKKKLFAILLLVAVCAGCGAEKEQTTMVTVDIATEHSEKEVVLQDFMMWNTFRWRQVMNL